MKLTQAEYSKNARTRRINAGICVRGCGGEPVTPSGLCERCRAHIAANTKARKARLRSLKHPPA